jgi:hypothetical protein
MDVRTSWLRELKEYPVAPHVDMITGTSGTPAYAMLPLVVAC